MTQIIIDYLPWLLSIITVFQVVIAGNKHKDAWLVSLWNQALWLLWIIVSGTYGLFLMNAMMWFVSIRNHLLWRKEAEGGRLMAIRKPPPDLGLIRIAINYLFRAGKGKLSKEVEALRRCYEGQEKKLERLEALETALYNLVALKMYRDQQGKTPKYLKEKPIVWQQARDVLGQKKDHGLDCDCSACCPN